MGEIGNMPEIMINGSEGRLEAKYHLSEHDNPPIALILHPHPQHGGTMNNKVVHAIYKTFVSKGFNVLRFNFRGVGRSEGRYSHGEGELRDALTALEFLISLNPHTPSCWISGFSFGAWIAMQLLMRRPDVSGFITVSPPANLYDFTFLSPCPVNGTIIQGDKDSIVDWRSVQTLAKRLDCQKDVAVKFDLISGADHFFHDRIDVLTQTIETLLDAETLSLFKAANY